VNIRYWKILLPGGGGEEGCCPLGEKYEKAKEKKKVLGKASGKEKLTLKG
jgi:hypothetical protein